MTTKRPNLVIEAGFANRVDAEEAVRWLQPDRTTAMIFSDAGDGVSSDLSVAEGASALAAQQASIVQWLSSSPEVKWLQLHGPHSQPASGTAWVLSFEYAGDDWETLLRRFEALPDIRFGVATLEESLELNRPVSLETLPWSYWGLVEAFVKDASGEVMRRTGPGRGRLA